MGERVYFHFKIIFDLLGNILLERDINDNSQVTLEKKDLLDAFFDDPSTAGAVEVVGSPTPEGMSGMVLVCAFNCVHVFLRTCTCMCIFFAVIQ